MNAWPFVIAAYAIVAVASIALTLTSWRWMRRAEGKAIEITGR